MSAPEAARYFARVPLEESAFYLAAFSADATPKWSQEGSAWQVKQALRQVGLTMAQVSALTSMQYGKKTPYFIPPTFLYKQKKGITPHICQIVALSHVTGYRFADWMRVFGFDLRLILALQLEIHTERTAIITPRHAVPAWHSSLIPRCSRLEKPNRRYVFAKIGSRDAVVYPRLLPGSIVRADPSYSPDVLDDASAPHLWLVEHPGGLTCCYVRRVDAQHIVLLPNLPPLPAWPLRIAREARVLGLVDLELRPREATPFVPMCGPPKSEVATMTPHNDRMSFSMLLRVSRLRAGLTLRAAHQITVRIARLLGKPDYGIALGLLSDYEAMDQLPRHVSKIMSLCIVYGIDPWELMGSCGINLEDSDEAPSPRKRSMDLRRIA